MTKREVIALLAGAVFLCIALMLETACTTTRVERFQGTADSVSYYKDGKIEFYHK